MRVNKNRYWMCPYRSGHIWAKGKNPVLLFQKKRACTPVVIRSTKAQMMMMKNILHTLLCIVLFATATMAQQTRFNLYGAYAFDDKVDSYWDNNLGYYNGRINGGFQWGGGLEYQLNPYYGLELKYLRMDTKAPMAYLVDASGPKSADFDMGINYILLGGKRYLPKGKLEGFGGASLGAAIFSIQNPTTNYQTTRTKFAWNFNLGANYWVASNVGIKFQTQLVSAVQSIGGGMFVGTGGVGGGVSSYSSMLQFSLGGGLVFRIPKAGAATPKSNMLTN